MNRSAGILTSFFALTLLLVVTSVSAAPKLTLPIESFDFGFVPQHSEISYKFWLKSSGDDTLEILKVIPGCGCTRTPLETNKLAAGDSTQLEVIFSTKTYRNRVAKSPTIQTNEGPPDKRVRITSTVVTRPDSTYPIIINPYKINLSQNTEKVIDQMEFTIENVSDQKLKFSLIYAPEDYIKVELPKSLDPGKSAKGKIKLQDDVLDESFEKSFTIELNDIPKSRFTLPVIRTAIPGQEHAIKGGIK